MKLTDILADCLNVLSLIRPHVRDDGDQYHAQLLNNVMAAHAAASEQESAIASAPAATSAAPATDFAPVLAAIAGVGSSILAAMPQTAPIMAAVQAVGEGLGAIATTVEAVHTAVTQPAATPAGDAAQQVA